MNYSLFIDNRETEHALISAQIRIFDVHTNPIFAKSGEEALKILMETHQNGQFPTVIVLDINLCQKHSFQLIKDFEANYFSDHPNTKIYFLADRPISLDEKKCINYKSVYGFYQRPFTKDMFVEMQGNTVPVVKVAVTD